MAGSFEDPVARIRRAAEHYRALKEEFHDGVDRKIRSVRVERHRQGREYRFYVLEVPPIAPEWPLILGEAYFQLRAALDNLVFQLHVRRFHGRVPQQAQVDSAFPVRLREWKHRNGSGKGQPIPTSDWKEVKRLSLRDRRAIEWLQPYKGVGIAYPPEQWIHSMRYAIADVDVINRVDKHRQLHLVQTAAQAVALPRFPTEYGFEQAPVFGVPLISGGLVDTWTFAVPVPVEQISVHGGVVTTVGFEPIPGKRLQALPHLGGSILAVAGALARFQNRFPAVETPLDLSWIRGSIG